MYGVNGRYLLVDLGEQKAEIREIKDGDFLNFLGGCGLNSYLLLENMDPSKDALSPENLLIFGVGPLVGTLMPTGNRTEVSAKSPLTGIFGSSNSGYLFGPELKYAGFDHLVVSGKANKPTYLFIENGKVHFKDATKFWGKDVWETVDGIKEELLDDQIQVASIGVGGENLVRFASIENGYFAAWGRTGLGAVMGSKKLKAIAIKGDFGEVKPYDVKGYMEAVSEAIGKVRNHITYGPWRKYGSMIAVDLYYQLGAIAMKNLQTLADDTFISTLSREVFLERLKKTSVGCLSCPIACGNWVEVPDGKYKGMKLKGVEITSTLDFGARCGIFSIDAIVKATELFQKLGIDCSTAASVIAYAIELFEKGIITKEDTGGISLKFGDEDTIFSLMEMIAKREGIGEILAEGPQRVAFHFEKDAKKYLTTIRGLETTSRDPRTRWDTWTFGYLINTRGGDHTRCQSPAENLRKSAPAGEYLYEFAPPQKVIDAIDMFPEMKEKVFTKDGKVFIPLMAIWSQNLMTIVNSVGVCMRPPVLHSIGPTLYAKLLSSLTGLEFTPKLVMESADRIFIIQRVFNHLCGERREDMKYPERFYRDELSGRRLDKREVDKVLDIFFEERGFDPKTALPKRETIRKLAIYEIVGKKLGEELI